MVDGTVTSASRVGAAGWDVVIGDRFIAALAAPADAQALAALAAVTGDAGISIEELVQVIPGASDDADQGFAVVWWSAEGGSVTAVVRGWAVVDLDSPGGSRRFDARGIRPWHLAEFRDVTGVRVTGADAPLLRGSAVGVALAPARTSLRATDVEWVPAPGTAAEPAAAPTTTSVAAEASGSALEATVDAALAIDDGETDAGAGSSFAPGPPPRVRIGSQSPRTVTVPILVGRRPLAPRTPGAAAAAPELVPVPSPTGVVSGTHLEIRIEGERLVATDLRSTNGTVLRTPTGVRRMRAGESIVVAPGSSLDLGDDTIIEVIPASDDAQRPTRTDRPPS